MEFTSATEATITAKDKTYMARPKASASAADKVAGKEALVMEQFANALMQLPAIMADNGGLDSAELRGQLRAAHLRGEHRTGLDFRNGGVADMGELGIMESFRSKMSQLCAAAEAAEMIIRVDDIIRNAPRERQGGY